MSDDLELRFGADASGVTAGGAQAESAVEGVAGTVKGLVDLLLEMGGAATGSFRMMRSGALDASESVKGAAESVKEFREAVSGIGEAIIAAFAVEQITEFAKKMGESGENTEHTAQRLGMSTAAVQQLGAAFTEMGVAPDRGVQAMGRLDRAMAMAKEGGKQQQDVFAQLGISMTHNYTQAQLLSGVMEGFKNMADGPAKTAAAMTLMGRSGAEMIPFLNQGAAGLEEINQATARYGVVNADAVEKAAQLGAAFNDNKNAGTGLHNVLAEALAPAFTSVVQGINDFVAGMISSYNHGGLVRQILDSVVTVMDVLGSIAQSIGALIADVWTDIFGKTNTAKGGIDLFRVAMIALGEVVAAAGVVIDTAFGIIGLAVKEVEDAFGILGRIVVDVLNGDFKKVKDDWTEGLHRMAQDAVDQANRIGTAWDEANKRMVALITNPPPKKELESTGQGEGNTGDDPVRTKAVNRVAIWREALQTQLEDEKNYFADSTSEELRFWQSKLSQVKAGTAEERGVKTQIYTLSKALAKQEYADQQADLTAQIAAQRRNSVEAIELAQEKASQVAATYGADSAQYKAAVRELETMERAHQEEMLKIAVRGIADRAKAEEALAGNEKALAQIRMAAAKDNEQMLVATGRITKAQEMADLVTFTQQEVAEEKSAAEQLYGIKLKALEDERAALLAKKQDASKVNGEIQILEQQHVAQMAQIDAQGALKMQQANNARLTQMAQQWHTYINGVVSSFGSGITGMIEGTMTFQQAMVKVGESILDVFVTAAEKMAEQWVVNLLVAQTQQAVTGVAQVTSNAAVAASAAFASTAAIPIVGPELAPEAALAAFSGAIAWAPLASAAGGYDIPSGINPVVQTHEEEMILPATLANPLRTLLGSLGGGGKTSGTTPGAGSVTHNHNWGGIQAIDARSFKSFLEANPDALSDVMARQFRNMRFA